MNQLLAAAGPYPLTKTWYVGGTPTDVGAVTIGIVDGNGDVVVTPGTATTNNADGTYDYTLADQPNPDVLTVTWTRTDTSADLVERVELVGAWLFTEAAARSFGAKADAASGLIPLDDEGEYPDDVIADERASIAELLENWTGRGWIPRYCRLELSGNGTNWLDLGEGFARTADGYALHRPGRFSDVGQLLSVSVGGSSQTVGDYRIDTYRNALISTNETFTVATSDDPFNVVVEFVYGLPYIVDGVDRIGMMMLVDRLVPSDTDRVLSQDNGYGQVRYVQPGGPNMNRTRLPEVNEWVMAHDARVMIG